MKISFDSYIIDVKVKLNGDEKYNKKAAFYFLNKISMLYREASENPLNKQLGIAKSYMEHAHDIYNFLDENGFYDDVTSTNK